MSEGARILEPGEVDDFIDVLHESFFDYPVMRFVLGDGPEYGEQLRTLIHFFAMARVLRQEMLFGVGSFGQLTGAAMVSRPGKPAPPELDQVSRQTWAALGPQARERYIAFADACGPIQPQDPHIHLNMIGVRKAAQGGGIGRLLLDHVHQSSAEDPNSSGVSLTTELESNVDLYKHVGYEVFGETDVSAELHSWTMFRRD